MPSGSSDRGSSRHSAGLLMRVLRPGEPAEEFYLAAGLTIGRSVANTVVLADDAVDRAHARVEIGADDTAILRCVEPGSSLTTGGEAVRELPLDAGVRFGIGRIEFECVPGRRGYEAGSHRARATCPFCDSTADFAAGDEVRNCPGCSNPLLPLRPDPLDPAPLLVPVSYDAYRADRFVARGGMGLVLKGVRAKDDEPVAIKVLLAGTDLDRQESGRFEREVTMLGRVRHPNVVELLGHGSSGGFNYLAMEWIEGPSVRRVIADARQAGKLTDFITAFRWFHQVGKGLAAIHAVGMIHRDLKPSNILIGPDGGARIADLGIAKRVDAGHTSYTTAGHSPGTFEYMAPEQLAAPDAVDGRADLYALGVTFHELLTGTRPVGAWRAASVVNPTVPKPFDALLGRLLDPTPDLRYDDVYELLAATSTFAKSAPGWPLPRASAAETAGSGSIRPSDHIPSPQSKRDATAGQPVTPNGTPLDVVEARDPVYEALRVPLRSTAAVGFTLTLLSVALWFAWGQRGGAERLLNMVTHFAIPWSMIALGVWAHNRSLDRPPVPDFERWFWLAGLAGIAVTWVTGSFLGWVDVTWLFRTQIGNNYYFMYLVALGSGGLAAAGLGSTVKVVAWLGTRDLGKLLERGDILLDRRPYSCLPYHSLNVVVACYSKAIRRDPRLAEAYRRRGTLYNEIYVRVSQFWDGR